MLPETPLSIPADPDGTSIDFELNLFAAKPDRAQALAEAGLLIEKRAGVAARRAGPRRSADAVAGTGIRTGFCTDVAEPRRALFQIIGCPRRLRRMAHGRQAPAQRYAALFYAFRALGTLCQRAAGSARLSTLARIAFEAGERVAGVQALQAIIGDLQRGSIQIQMNSWPACPRFDTIAANGRTGQRL